MIEKLFEPIVIHIANLIQDDPEMIARAIATLVVWDLFNTILAVVVAIATERHIGRIVRALKEECPSKFLGKDLW